MSAQACLLSLKVGAREGVGNCPLIYVSHVDVFEIMNHFVSVQVPVSFLVYNAQQRVIFFLKFLS